VRDGQRREARVERRKEDRQRGEVVWRRRRRRRRIRVRGWEEGATVVGRGAVCRGSRGRKRGLDVSASVSLAGLVTGGDESRRVRGANEGLWNRGMYLVACVCVLYTQCSAVYSAGQCSKYSRYGQYMYSTAPYAASAHVHIHIHIHPPPRVSTGTWPASGPWGMCRGPKSRRW
jgi:hypothetical protein